MSSSNISLQTGVARERNELKRLVSEVNRDFAAVLRDNPILAPNGDISKKEATNINYLSNQVRNNDTPAIQSLSESQRQILARTLDNLVTEDWRLDDMSDPKYLKATSAETQQKHLKSIHNGLQNISTGLNYYKIQISGHETEQARQAQQAIGRTFAPLTAAGVKFQIKNTSDRFSNQNLLFLAKAYSTPEAQRDMQKLAENLKRSQKALNSSQPPTFTLIAGDTDGAFARDNVTLNAGKGSGAFLEATTMFHPSGLLEEQINVSGGTYKGYEAGSDPLTTRHNETIEINQYLETFNELVEKGASAQQADKAAHNYFISPLLQGATYALDKTLDRSIEKEQTIPGDITQRENLVKKNVARISTPDLVTQLNQDMADAGKNKFYNQPTDINFGAEVAPGISSTSLNTNGKNENYGLQPTDYNQRLLTFINSELNRFFGGRIGARLEDNPSSDGHGRTVRFYDATAAH